MKSVFQINTVYQLMISINMCIHQIPDGDLDIIVTDHTPILIEYMDTLRNSGLFNKVFYVESLAFNNRFWQTDNSSKADFFYDSKRELSQTLMEAQVDYSEYQVLYLANLDAYSKCIYHVYPHLRINLIEDGASVCTNDWKTITLRWNYIKGFNKIYDVVEKLYLYTPDLMCVDLGYPMVKLPEIDADNAKTLELYNYIFKYDHSFAYPQFVFLEEPFVADDLKNNDLELMKIISEEVGYENFFIKTHPRNTDNRSKALGIAQQKETPWPFELILMNNIKSNSIYITVDSGALISTRTLFHQDVKTMFLYKIIKGPTHKVACGEFINYMDKFCQKYSSKNLLIPRSINELRTMLKLLGDNKND